MTANGRKQSWPGDTPTHVDPRLAGSPTRRQLQRRGLLPLAVAFRQELNQAFGGRCHQARGEACGRGVDILDRLTKRLSKHQLLDERFDLFRKQGRKLPFRAIERIGQ